MASCSWNFGGLQLAAANQLLAGAQGGIHRGFDFLAVLPGVDFLDQLVVVSGFLHGISFQWVGMGMDMLD